MIYFIFFLSFILLFYTYLGYLIILFICSLFINKKISKGNFQPHVTVIIPVHNEEKLIGIKLQNCLELDYPKEKLDIVVVSDDSTDHTEEIVKSLKNDQIKFIATPGRVGKVNAQNLAVKNVSSEIIVFTDVAITTHPDSIKLIVKNFSDKKIGAVSCRDYINDAQSSGEGYYIKYDMLVRKYSSQINTLIGVTGGFYAIRKELANEEWNAEFPPDFYIAIKCIKSKLRVVEDPDVKAYYKTTSNGQHEFVRKVRTINRGMHAIFSNSELLNIFKYGFSSFQIFSHKILRWLTPFFFISLFISNALLIKESFIIEITFICQLVLYSLSVIAILFHVDEDKNLIFKIPSYFRITNLALLKAWYEFFIGKKYTYWQPTKR